MNTSSFAREPRLIHRVTAVRSAGSTSSMPALRDGLVALAGHDDTIVQLIDVRRGVECGRVRSERAFRTGAPTFATDDSVLLGVWETEKPAVLRVSRDGSVRSRDVLTTAVSPGDFGTFQFASIDALDDDVLCSTLDRQGVVQSLARRSLGTSVERWSIDEWLLARSEGVVLSASTPRGRPKPKMLRLPPAETWNAREVLDGGLRWSLDAADRTLLGVARDRFVYVDRQAQIEERGMRGAKADRAFLAGHLDEDAMVAAWDAPANAPCEIVTGCLDDGLELNRVQCAAPIVGAWVDARGSAVITRTNDGATNLFMQDADGLGVAEFLLDAPVRAGAEGPAVVGRRDDVLLVAWAFDLDGVDVHTGRTLWRLAMPDALHGLAPRVVDRDLERRDMAVDDEFIVVRGQETLYVISAT